MRPVNEDSTSAPQLGLKGSLLLAIAALDKRQKAPRGCFRMGWLWEHRRRPRRAGTVVSLTRDPVKAHARNKILVSVWKHTAEYRSKYRPHQGVQERARRLAPVVSAAAMVVA